MAAEESEWRRASGAGEVEADGKKRFALTWGLPSRGLAAVAWIMAVPPGREARTDRAYRVHPRRPPPPTASVSPVLRADPPSLLQLALPILSDSSAATQGALLRAEELQEWFVRIAIQVWLVRLQEGSSRLFPVLNRVYRLKDFVSSVQNT